VDNYLKVTCETEAARAAWDASAEPWPIPAPDRVGVRSSCWVFPFAEADHDSARLAVQRALYVSDVLICADVASLIAVWTRGTFQDYHEISGALPERDAVEAAESESL